MNTNSVDLRDIKIMSLEPHWPQDQFAEMSVLSLRTIHRVENMKGFYKLFAVAVLSLVAPFIMAENDS